MVENRHASSRLEGEQLPPCAKLIAASCGGRNSGGPCGIECGPNGCSTSPNNATEQSSEGCMLVLGHGTRGLDHNLRKSGIRQRPRSKGWFFGDGVTLCKVGPHLLARLGVDDKAPLPVASSTKLAPNDAAHSLLPVPIPCAVRARHGPRFPAPELLHLVGLAQVLPVSADQLAERVLLVRSVGVNPYAALERRHRRSGERLLLRGRGGALCTRRSDAQGRRWGCRCVLCGRFPLLLRTAGLCERMRQQQEAPNLGRGCGIRSAEELVLLPPCLLALL